MSDDGGRSWPSKVMRLDVSQFLSLLPELFTEFWMCDADQRMRTLADALAIKVDSAVFCHDPMDVIACGHHASSRLESGDDAAHPAACGCAGQGDDGDTSL